MTFTEKTLRWIFRICISIFLLYLACMSIIYFLLQRNPEDLAGQYLSELSRRTGLDFSFGAVDVTLLPLPSMAISNISIKGANLDFSAAWISGRPDFLKLLRGIATPAKIIMLRPKLALATDLPLLNPEDAFKHLRKILKKDGDATSNFPPVSCGLNIAGGQCSIKGKADSRLLLNNLHCELQIREDGDMEGEVQIGALRWLQNDSAIFNLEGIHISGESSYLNFFEDTHALKISGEARWLDHLPYSKFSADFDGSTSGWSGKASLAGDMEIEKNRVPFSVSLRAVRLARSGEIALRGLEWTLDADSGGINAILTLPNEKHGFGLSGTLLLHRASLSQWFGFARNLAPGLQIALDNILQASIDFSLDSQGLSAPRISAVCSGAKFTGSGSVADFSKPVVALDLRSKSVNLGLAIPESLGNAPLPVWFAYSPLTPMPGEPPKPGETGIGYDIRLAADNLIYGPVKMTDASLRIHPGKMDRNGLEDTLLDAKARLYGGDMQGSCILGADKKLPCGIAATVRNVDGSALARDMGGLPIRSGKFHADANISSMGKKLAIFLERLQGKINIRGENATLAATGPKSVFSSLETNAVIKTASLQNERLMLDGKWKTSLKSARFEENSEMDGKIFFSVNPAGVTFKNLPGKLALRLNEPAGFLRKNTQISLRGNFGGNASQETFSVSNGVLEIMGLEVNCNLALNGGKPSWKGGFSAKIPDAGKIIRQLDGNPDAVPAFLNSMKLDADFSGNPESLAFSKIKMDFGQGTVSGSLDWRMEKDRPSFNFALSVNRLDMEKLFSSKTPGTRTVQAKNTTWDFKLFRSFDANGKLDIKELEGWRISIQNAQIPLRLSNGRLTLGPVAARCYDATLNCRGVINFDRGISISSALAINGFNLGKAAEGHNLETAFTGMASLDAKIYADLTGPGQLPKALNGDWSFNIVNGSWQARAKNGKPKGKPTEIKRAQASGKITNGVLKSQDFSLRNQSMQVNGGGWLNLKNQNLDCNFNVSMKGIPDFPLRLYGTIDNSKTSIGAGKMVMNAIGGITSGFVNGIGNILEGAWKVFR